MPEVSMRFGQRLKKKTECPKPSQEPEQLQSHTCWAELCPVLGLHRLGEEDSGGHGEWGCSHPQGPQLQKQRQGCSSHGPLPTSSPQFLQDRIGSRRNVTLQQQKDGVFNDLSLF